MDHHVFEFLPDEDFGSKNESYDYENFTSIPPCDQEKFRSVSSVLLPTLYAAILVLGVFGNVLMVTVLLRRRCGGAGLRVTEVYLLYLAAADLALLAALPFDAVEIASGWVFGDFLCKVTGLVRILNQHCGSLLLACIGVDRYLAIVHAVPSMQSRQRRTVHVTCVSLWLLCLCLSVPNAVFLSVGVANTSGGGSDPDPASAIRLSCTYHRFSLATNNWNLISRLLDHATFFLPLAVMSYCYAAVVLTLCRSTKSQTKTGAIRLALLLTLVFFCCWLPYNVALLVATLADLDVISYESCAAYVMLRPALKATQILGLAHCCLNPFLYAFAGVRFRKELVRFLCRFGCSRRCAEAVGGARGRGWSVSDAVTSTSTVHA